MDRKTGKTRAGKAALKTDPAPAHTVKKDGQKHPNPIVARTI